MELTMAAQENVTPWEAGPILNGIKSQELGHNLPGRGYFAQLGIVRRKPARGDAPPTLSKSCSDKLALKQCTSLLSSLAALFVSPENVYLHSLILPESGYSAMACERAFSEHGRMKPFAGRQWPGGYSYKPFQVATTRNDFSYSKAMAKSRSEIVTASNVAAYWTCHGVDESLIGGVLSGNKAFNITGASLVSRRKMWSLALDDACLLGVRCMSIHSQLSSASYGEAKAGELLDSRKRVKEEVTQDALKGWVKNDGDADFELERPPGHLA
jgi:tRNA-specific adenosine deaminase 1